MTCGRPRRGGRASRSSIVPNAMLLGAARRMPSTSSAIRNTPVAAAALGLFCCVQLSPCYWSRRIKRKFTKSLRIGFSGPMSIRLVFWRRSGRIWDSTEKTSPEAVTDMVSTVCTVLERVLPPAYMILAGVWSADHAANVYRDAFKSEDGEESDGNEPQYRRLSAAEYICLPSC